MGDIDIFVAKYDLNGSLLWAKRAGGTGSEAGGKSIAVDTLGNSYVSGSFFNSSVTFGSGEANETTLTNAGLDDIFIAKYNSSGALMWAKRSGGTGEDYGNAIAIDGSANSYVTGSFDGTATFGAGEANETSLTVAGGYDMFIAKYDSNGALVWARQAGGAGEDIAWAIAVDNSGNSYVMGSYTGPATFGPGESGETILMGSDSFIAKFSGGNNAPADFDGNGISDIGVYRDGGWYLDLNGNDQWDGCGVDGCYVFGSAGDQAIVGDWTGSGQAMLGVYRDGGWYLDLNGNNQWDGCGVDGCYVFGSAGDQVVAGDWTGSGQAMFGIFRDGGWYLDLNGNNQWDGCGVDGCYGFGLAGDIPAN